MKLMDRIDRLEHVQGERLGPQLAPNSPGSGTLLDRLKGWFRKGLRQFIADSYYHLDYFMLTAKGRDSPFHMNMVWPMAIDEMKRRPGYQSAVGRDVGDINLTNLNEDLAKELQKECKSYVTNIK